MLLYKIEPDQVHYLDVKITSNHSANVSWHPPVSLKGIIISYHLVVRNLTKKHSVSFMDEWILSSKDRDYTIEDLGKSSQFFHNIVQFC